LLEFPKILPFCCLLVALLFATGTSANASSHVTLYPIPAPVRSAHYLVSINGKISPVVHAASDYYLLNFDTDGPVTVKVTAEDPRFWDRGVEIQPMRLGIRPVRKGATISFRLPGPQKITISRPNDHFAEADMLFLFANPPESVHDTAKTPGIRYYGPGVYHASIDARSGDTIYLAGGAVVFGALNIWQVHDVRVLGRGMIIYSGPQNPDNDNGWMHKRNWHAIVMDNAHNIEIDGITTIVRSRTWQIQMKDSRNIGFYNVKVVAGTKGDANQDGMDWLGGGDTTVRDSFFRASDDVFALQGNWDGYHLALMRKPGHDVTNISIDGSVVSTSISNTVRVAWPQKTFNSANFSMSNMDVLHTGYGDCTVPFAFFELWADPDGHGSHRNYNFENIRLDDWYSLFQIRQPAPMVRDVHFSGIWAMDEPAMVPSALKGDVRGVTLQDVAIPEDRPVEVLEGATPAEVIPATVSAAFTYSAGILKPGQPVRFEATGAPAAGRQFHWLFGDGSTAEGITAVHRFPDAQGTLLDGSGRFRVLLHVVDANGAQSWQSETVVLKTPADQISTSAPPSAANRSELTEQLNQPVQIPAAGGYTFTLLVRGDASVAIDDQAPVTAPVPRSRACGSAESAAQPLRVSTTLGEGAHTLHIRYAGDTKPVVLWGGPGLLTQLLPAQ
jgi:hypothetical protein